MGSADAEGAEERRRRLVAELAAKGLLRSRAWQDAFVAVPRHRLIPEPIYLNVDGGWTSVRSDDPQWLDLIYSDATLVTQLNNGRTGVSEGEGVPTSSTTAPGLMAVMLEALDTGGDHNVLEIGTGVGYNAALLAHGLGSDRVTTVDVDSGLAEAASVRLRSIGYTPTVAAADGLRGYPETGHMAA